MKTFPELSRKPALKTRGTSIDGTLRDAMQNGAEATSAQWTRFRREWNVTLEALTQRDVELLDDFVDRIAVQGVNPFIFKDGRNPRSPRNLFVRFATLPAYTDFDNTEAYGVRQNVTFTLREV